MRVIAHSPPKPLGAWVASIWYFEGLEISHAMERILPNGAMQLLVNLNDNELRWWDGNSQGCVRRLPGAACAGAFARPFAIDTAQQRMITGVSFAPGGAAAFFRGSMREFANDHVALSGLPGCESIRDELLEAHSRSVGEVLKTWERFLRARWSPERCRGVRNACAQLEAGFSVQQVADRMSVSVRKLRQDFAASVGLSPKTYARVYRLQRLVGSVATIDRERDWAALAVQHGYFDQSHMVHEFRALTGLTPTTYFPRSPDDWNHTILADADSYNTDSRAHARKA